MVPSRELSPDAAWRLNGKLGIVSGEHRGSFGIDWQHFSPGFEIDLFGPLGMGVARVTSHDGVVTLEMPGEPTVTATSADDLLYRVTGLEIPVDPMRNWVRGRPAPGRVVRTNNGFIQDGWQVEYLEMEGELPRRIRVSRPEARLVLIIREWGA